MNKIKHAFYINLEGRTDRKQQVEKEFQQLNIPIIRFNAVKLHDGRVGCSLSHLKCLMIAKEQDWSHVLIAEDDIQFLNPELFCRQLDDFLSSETEWDVVMIAGNNIPPYEKNGTHSIKVTRCHTTTGYIIKRHYYDTLINNIKEGISQLMKEPTNHFLYAIDKYWFQLQLRDNWYLIVPLTVSQRDGYSDIEKKQINYSQLMLDIDKLHLINNNKHQNIQWKTPIEDTIY